MSSAFPAPSVLSALKPTEGSVWLRTGKLFTGTDAQVVRDGHVVYDRSGILYAGARPPPVEVLRSGCVQPDVFLPDHGVMPGLTDAHTHLFLEGGELDPVKRAEYLKLPSEAYHERAQPRLRRLVALGVTAVREAGDKVGVGTALQARWRSSQRGVMPYVDAPGAAIHHAGRYGSFMARPMEEQGSPAATVAERVAGGAHRIKLLATGIINFEKGAVTAKPQMPASELAEFVAASRAAGRQTMVHCSGSDGVANCLEARVDSIEHGFFVTDDQLAALRDRDLAWVPTFAPVQFQVDHAATLGWTDQVRENLQRILDQHARSLIRAVDLGVRVIAGSDSGSHGVPHGWGFLRELELMQTAGMPALRVLHSATGAASARLGFSEKLGVLEKGAAARFLIVTPRVMDDVRALRESKVVVFDGDVFAEGDDPTVPGL